MTRPTITTSDAQATYRYLRIGILAVVVMLGWAVWTEHQNAGCWQTSISAYYYTPARAIFVGGLMAVGFALIVIKGATLWEDIFLNIAGMLAPVVALAPTSGAGTCWSIEPVASPRVPRDAADPDGPWVLAEWVRANIENNIEALLVVGIAGLVIAAGIAVITNRTPTALVTVVPLSTAIGLAVTLSLLALGWLALRQWDDFETQAHGIAAVAFFVFLAAAAVESMRDRWSKGERTLAVGYGLIAVAMVATFAVIYPMRNRWDHAILVLEALEIVWFGVFWAVQTWERWREPVTTSPSPSTSGSA
ncbi:MAG: hypothetical protein AAGD33_02885 [Actinomycetota bacterium]